MKDFIAFAEKMEVPFDEEGYNTSENYLKTQIKAWMARNLWDISASYEVFTVIDDAYSKALEVIEDEALFSDWKIQY